MVTYYIFDLRQKSIRLPGIGCVETRLGYFFARKLRGKRPPASEWVFLGPVLAGRSLWRYTLGAMGITGSSATAKVSSKGWVVIPADLRYKYHIEPGDEVRIVDYGGILALLPSLQDPVHEARGALAGAGSLTRALLDERRREREREGG